MAVLEAEVVGDPSDARPTLRYRVLADRGEGPREYRWLAKQYRGAKAERVWNVLRFLNAQISADLMTVEPIGFSPTSRLVITGELEGVTLADSLRGTPEDDVEVGLKRAGKAIASMHGLAFAPKGGLKRHGPVEEIDILEGARARAGESILSTEVLDRFQALCAATEDELRAGGATAPRALLHRDLDPARIVLREDAIGLIDLDDAARGEPELDLGNLEAHLLLEDLQWGGEIGPATARIDALCRGYRTGGEFDPDRLQTYTRSALLRLATNERLADPGHCVLDWPALSSALLQVGEQMPVEG